MKLQCDIRERYRSMYRISDFNTYISIRLLNTHNPMYDVNVDMPTIKETNYV